MFASVADQHFARLGQLVRDANAAREAADTASAALFSGEPIPQIGTEAWLALWASARAFSEQDAYPERAFPVNDEGSVCVLCQQELSHAASHRLNRFEAFVRNDSHLRAEEARVRLVEALRTFEAARLSVGDIRDNCGHHP